MIIVQEWLYRTHKPHQRGLLPDRVPVQTHRRTVVSSLNTEQLFWTSWQLPVEYPLQRQLSEHDCHAMPVKTSDHPEHRLQSDQQEALAVVTNTNARTKNCNFKLFAILSTVSSFTMNGIEKVKSVYIVADLETRYGFKVNKLIHRMFQVVKLYSQRW